MNHSGYLSVDHSWVSVAVVITDFRKFLGKLLILGATDTQVSTSSRGYSATVEHCTNHRRIYHWATWAMPPPFELRKNFAYGQKCKLREVAPIL